MNKLREARLNRASNLMTLLAVVTLLVTFGAGLNRWLGSYQGQRVLDGNWGPR
jgi:hypothetical protein